jgi:hypothetical protein
MYVVEKQSQGRSFYNIKLLNILLIVHKLCDRLGSVNFQSADQDIKVPTEVHLCLMIISW